MTVVCLGKKDKGEVGTSINMRQCFHAVRGGDSANGPHSLKGLMGEHPSYQSLFSFRLLTSQKSRDMLMCTATAVEVKVYPQSALMEELILSCGIQRISFIFCP